MKKPHPVGLGVAFLLVAAAAFGIGVAVARRAGERAPAETSGNGVALELHPESVRLLPDAGLRLWLDADPPAPVDVRAPARGSVSARPP